MFSEVVYIYIYAMCFVIIQTYFNTSLIPNTTSMISIVDIIQSSNISLNPTIN